jgi:hypothetical protein
MHFNELARPFRPSTPANTTRPNIIFFMYITRTTVTIAAGLALSNALAAPLPLQDKKFAAQHLGFAADNSRACLAGDRFNAESGQGSGELLLLDVKRDAVRWHVHIAAPDGNVSLQPVQCAIDGENVYLLANVNTQAPRSLNQGIVYLYQFNADGKQLGYKRLVVPGRNKYGYALGTSADGMQVAGYIKDEDEAFEYYSLFTVSVDRKLNEGKLNVRKTGAFANDVEARFVGDNLHIGGMFLPSKLAKNDWASDFANSRLLANGGYAWSMRPFKQAPRNVKAGLSQQGAIYSLAYGGAGSTLALTSAEGKQLSLSSYPSKFCETESISEYGDAVLALRKPCDEKRKAAELLVIAPASGKESALRLAPGEPVFAATNLGQWFVVSRDAAGKLSLNMGAIDGGTHFSHTSAGVEHSLHISRIKIDQKGERSFEYAYEQRAGECRFSIAGHAAEVDVFNPQGKDGKEGPQIVMYDGEGATLTLPHVGPPRQVYFDSVLSPEQLKRSCGNIKGGKLALVFNEAGVRR